MHLHEEIPQSKIQKTANEFIGKIRQTPPRRSAVKREERSREIYYLNIYEIDNKDVLFKVGCEAGTYIRTLCHVWGKKLGVGAHMSQLVRTKAGPFTDKDWVSLHDLKDAYEVFKEGDETPIRKVILPVENAVSHLPKIWVFDTTVDSLCHGASLSLPGISKIHSNISENDLVAVFTLKEELVCLGNALMDSGDMIKNERGLAVKTSKVFMEPNTYPKYVKQKEPVV